MFFKNWLNVYVILHWRIVCRINKTNFKKKIICPHIRLRRRSIRKKILLSLSLILLLSQIGSFVPVTYIYAASSPWTQTDWSTESGSNIDTTSVPGQITLQNNEELSNTGFESDLSGWSTSNYSQTLQNTEASNLIAYYPLNETSGNSAQAINPAVSKGRDIVINGGFDADSDWTKGDGWSISGGLASSDGSQTTYSNIYESYTVLGKTFEVTFTVSNYSTGLVRFIVGDTGVGTNRSADGTYTETIVGAGSLNRIHIQANADFVGSIDNVSVKQLNIAASTSYPGSELLNDGNMEAADTSAWTAYHSGALSKETTNPHGGTQLLRVSYNGSANPGTLQGPTTSGKRYRAHGYTRSDGTTTPYIGPSLWSSGTTSTSWQEFDFEFIATSSNFILFCNATVAGQYVEFDDISVTEVNPFNGTNTSVTQGATGIGDGNTAFSYNGASSYTNIYSSEINSAFSPDAGTLLAWAKVSESGVWSDGTGRRLIVINSSSNNQLLLTKNATSNQLLGLLTFDGISKGVNITSTTTNWFLLAMTWDKSTNELKVFLDGVQQGTTQTGLGTWSGNLSSTSNVIGAGSTTPSLIWSGNIAHVALWNTALTPTEIAALYANVVSSSHDTATTYGSSSGSAKLVATTDSIFTQSVNVGDTNEYNLSTYAYTDGSAVTSSDLELYYNGSTIATTYTSAGGGWYKLTGTITGAAASRDYGLQVKAGKTVYIDNFSLNSYSSSGTFNSSIFDTEYQTGALWGVLNYSATTPTNTSITVKVRTSNSATMAGAPDFSTCTVATTGSDISGNNCVTDSDRYIQYQATLSTTDITISPSFQNISIAFENFDLDAPTIILNSLTPDPTRNNTPTLSGTATDANGTISIVQYQLDSTTGTWINCQAIDGNFDEISESFACTPASAISDGRSNIQV